MKYCVIKNTITIIDGSYNTQEVMLQNAINAGFTVDEVEILTEQEYEARKELEPIPPKEPTEIEVLQNKITELEAVIDTMLTGGTL